MPDTSADDVADLAGMAVHWTTSFTKDADGRPRCISYADNRAYVVMRPRKGRPNPGNVQIAMLAKSDLGRRYVVIERFMAGSPVRQGIAGPFIGPRWKRKMMKTATRLLNECFPHDTD